ncbi:MAG: phage tail tape measure protein, partial [Magnetococcales bacterium]|nr:phage tail tape measure protein [Magnetococcales bacterium]
MATTDRNLEFVLRMSTEQFVRATAQARQQFVQLASAVTADGRRMSSITQASGAGVDRLRVSLAEAGIGMHNASGEASRLRLNLDQVGQASGNASRSLQSVGTAAATVAASVYGASRTLGGVLTLFAGFDDTMRQVKVATEATGVEYLDMTELARNMGATTRYSAQEAASALLVLTTSGLKAGEAMTALPATLELAAASATDLARAAEITTTIMNGYGFSATNLAAINDVLIRATLDTNSSLSDLGSAFSYVGPVAKATGLDFKDTAAVLGVMADAGFKGERGGTALSGALSRLINPSKEVEKTLQELGVTVSAGGGKLINLIEIFRKLTAVGATPAQMMKIFGEESGRAMIAAADRGVPAMEKLRAAFENAGGTANRAAKEMEGGLGGSFRNLSSAAEGLGLRLGEDLAPAAKSAADTMASLFTGLARMPAPLRENIELVSGVVAGLALWVLGLRPLIIAINAYTAAQVRATAATLTFSRVLKTVGWVGLGLMVYEAGRYIHLWGNEMEEAAEKTDALTDALERQDEALKKQKENARKQEEATKKRAEDFAFQQKALKTVSPELAAAIESQEKAANKAKDRRNAAIAALSKPDNMPEKQKTTPKDEEGGEDQFSAFRTELERKKEANGDYFRDTLQMEADFWQKKRQISGLSQKDLASIDHEIFQIHKRQAHDSLNDRLELLREEMDRAMEGSQERIDIAKRAAKE